MKGDIVGVEKEQKLQPNISMKVEGALCRKSKEMATKYNPRRAPSWYRKSMEMATKLEC